MASVILVVEDDGAINEVVAAYMKDAGYIVLSAMDGGEALDILRSGKDIDLFILHDQRGRL